MDVAVAVAVALFGLRNAALAAADDRTGSAAARSGPASASESAIQLEKREFDPHRVRSSLDADCRQKLVSVMNFAAEMINPHPFYVIKSTWHCSGKWTNNYPSVDAKNATVRFQKQTTTAEKIRSSYAVQFAGGNRRRMRDKSGVSTGGRTTAMRGPFRPSRPPSLSLPLFSSRSAAKAENKCHSLTEKKRHRVEGAQRDPHRGTPKSTLTFIGRAAYWTRSHWRVRIR